MSAGAPPSLREVLTEAARVHRETLPPQPYLMDAGPDREPLRLWPPALVAAQVRSICDRYGLPWPACEIPIWDAIIGWHDIDATLDRVAGITAEKVT